MTNKSTWRWVLLLGIIFALILIPFLLFGVQIETWLDNFLESASDQPALVMLVLTLMLAFDILLPIPSSIVSTSAGYFLGFTTGTWVSLAGMTISNLIGFWLGNKFGRPMAARFVGDSELKRLEKMSKRFGDWVIVISRPVPVLAEASVFFAGISHLLFYRFLLLSTLSNLGISAIYAAVGAYSSTLNSFLLAFAGSMLLPAIAMLFAKQKKQNSQETHHDLS
ncbi:MAG: hypothetical protein B6I38_00990 [Anaerolineaceae bacterium 4572_5.1]|nr:MAG: hypothetical protein B5M51_09790 [Anaerolinea sp. 4484_236]OQY35894.1 MAG: hypothetical protein B6I38_00990 [Anaerolineaceae bacterium 4572_5.1]RLD09900.1 MAG: DedA family protein [Chloroflexota bacterium]